MSKSNLRNDAEQGNADAQFKLGAKYARGEELNQDFEKALQWWHLAADQNHAEAQFNIGDFYYNGRGVSANAQEAYRWFRLAAEQGYSPAQFNLGNGYSYGDGVPLDVSEALKWYRLAAEQKNADALYNLAFLYEEGEKVPQDYTEAARLYRLAGIEGCSAAMYDLSLLYRDGLGVSKDEKEANLLCVISADGSDGGDPRAQFDIGMRIFEEKAKGTHSGVDEAINYFSKAANQGHANAQYMLGLCYEKGDGVVEDFDQAIYWYIRAAEQGNANAQDKLAEHEITPHPDNENVIIKALCVKQPFASLIIDGLKTLEIRSWKLPDELIGQDILLCASSSPKGFKVPADGDQKAYKLPSGCALGMIRFSGYTKFTHKMTEASFSAWSPGQYAWEISDIAYIKPFSIKGKLKFFDVDYNLVEGSDEHHMTFVDHATGELL